MTYKSSQERRADPVYRARENDKRTTLRRERMADTEWRQIDSAKRRAHMKDKWADPVWAARARKARNERNRKRYAIDSVYRARVVAQNRLNQQDGRRKVYDQTYYAKHREKAYAATRSWMKRHAERVRELGRQGYWRAPEVHRQCVGQYFKTHPEIRRELARRRKTRLRASGVLSGHHTRAEWEAQKTAQHGKCYYCGIAPERLFREHMTPLSRGGADTIENIVAACSSCNSRKYTLTAEEFFARMAKAS